MIPWRLLPGLLMIGLALVLTVPQSASAAGWLSIGHTGFVSGDTTLSLKMPFVGQPSLSIQSSVAGDLKWVATNVPFTISNDFAAPVIDAVSICYKAPDTGTYIGQIRLAEFLGPSTALVRHDDATHLTSPTDACYISPVANYVPQGSVNLLLRLNFANPAHKIWIGVVAVHLK